MTRDPLFDLPEGLKAIRVQAAERGVPVPVGATLGELAAAGWEVRRDLIDAAVLREDAKSPTGYVVQVPFAAVEALIAGDDTLPEHKVVVSKVERIPGARQVMMGYAPEGSPPKEPGAQLDEGEIMVEPTITLAWIRRHKVAKASVWLPDWATVRHFVVNHEGFCVGVNMNTCPAVAPSAADFEAEDERRGAAGLPPLLAWQRPTVTAKTWIRHDRGKTTKEIMAVHVSIDDIEDPGDTAVVTGIDPRVDGVQTVAHEGGLVHVDPKTIFATTESFNEGKDE